MLAAEYDLKLCSINFEIYFYLAVYIVAVYIVTKYLDCKIGTSHDQTYIVLNLQFFSNTKFKSV